MQNVGNVLTPDSKLEEHLREHDNAEKFKCRLCESEFYSEWRLKKHIEGHQQVNRKCCHYYNNGKKCPFAEIGCKFKHEISYECFHGKGCGFSLCQYRHKTQANTGEEQKDTIDNKIGTEKENAEKSKGEIKHVERR